MNFKQLQYVLTLEKVGSFGKAADVLSISQPSLSQYIKNIEKQLGVELFNRTGGNVRLTDAGKVYVEVGRKILELDRQMQNEFNELSLYKKGSVVIGTSPYRSAGMMPSIARMFQNRFPGMYIVIEEMVSNELLESMEQGAFDLCLTILPVNERIFQYVKIAEEELVLAVPGCFPKLPSETIEGRRHPSIEAEQINHEAFVMITENQVMQRTLDNLCMDYGLELSKAAVVKSLEAQIAMVRAGVGMALVPAGIERFCAKDEVTFYSFKQELPRREVVAIWKKDRKLSQVIEELLDIMKAIEW